MKEDEISEFLGVFKPSSRKVYRAGLLKFQGFLKATGRGTVSDFLDALESDVRLPRRQRKRVGEKVIREFVARLEKEGFCPKSIRTYVSAVQSLVSYYGLKLSTRYVSLPSSQPASKKYPWTLEEVGDFILSMEDPELRSLAATMLQSGLSLGDVLSITWGDIKREYLRGMVPLCLDFSRKKTDVPFMTFIGQFAVNLLREHLGTKPKMKDSDPIYTLSERVVQMRFKKLSRRRLGKYKGYNPQRPHSLRSAFRTFLGDGGMPADEIHFFMGHQLPEQKEVYMCRSRDGWRRFYAKYEHALTPKMSNIGQREERSTLEKS